MVVGLYLFFFGYLIFGPSVLGSILQYFVVGIPTTAALPLIYFYPDVFVFLPLSVAAWFKGVASFRFILIVADRISTVGSLLFGGSPSTASSSSGGSGLKWWVFFRLLGLLVPVFGVWLAIYLISIGELTFGEVTNDLIIAWSLTTLAGAIVGLTWRFWSVRERITFVVMAGLILLLAGAELYNMRTFQSEITIYLGSKVAFVLGYGAAVAIWIVKSASNTRRYGRYA
jgi:hypothetical protein